MDRTPVLVRRSGRAEDDHTRVRVLPAGCVVLPVHVQEGPVQDSGLRQQDRGLPLADGCGTDGLFTAARQRGDAGSERRRDVQGTVRGPGLGVGEGHEAGVAAFLLRAVRRGSC